MDAEQGMQAPGAPGMPESRTGAFDVGLNADSARYNALVPKSFVQTSVLQNPYPTMNGMDEAAFNRIVPGMKAPLSSPNGSSSGSYDQSLLMRLRGQTIA